MAFKIQNNYNNNTELIPECRRIYVIKHIYLQKDNDLHLYSFKEKEQTDIIVLNDSDHIKASRLSKVGAPFQHASSNLTPFTNLILYLG